MGLTLIGDGGLAGLTGLARSFKDGIGSVGCGESFEGSGLELLIGEGSFGSGYCDE